jgi:hypothetical protein
MANGAAIRATLDETIDPVRWRAVEAPQRGE